jgi:hypothetical protein
VVKRVFVELRERVSYLKRLAFFTFTEEEAAGFDFFHLTGSKAQDIDALLTVDEVDIETNYRALDCYVTYKETIEQSKIKQFLTPQAAFEIYQEAYDPPLESLFEKLREPRVEEATSKE